MCPSYALLLSPVASIDDSAALLSGFIYDVGHRKDIRDEYFDVLYQVLDKDPDFVYDFKARTRRILLDDFSQKVKAVSMGKLMEKLDGMTIEH
jgi:hypothetical protein